MTVIEIQHSPIALRDLVSRTQTYPNVKWIFDCSNVKFKLEETVLQECVTTEMVLSYASPPLHNGIKDLIIAHKCGMLKKEGQPSGKHQLTMYIDVGDNMLYAVVDYNDCQLNQQRLHVEPMNRNDFLKSMSTYYKTCVKEWPRNIALPHPYRAPKPISRLDWDIVGVTEPLPFKIGRNNLNFPTFEPLSQFKVYLRRIIEQFFVTPMRSGKYKNVPLFAVPAPYRKYLLDNKFGNGSLLSTIETLFVFEDVIAMPNNTYPQAAFAKLRTIHHEVDI